MPTQPCIERNSKAAVRSTFTSPLRLTRPISSPRSLSDINLSTAANDPRPSASFSARKNPQRIPANTPPVFPGLRPRIWPHLLRLVTKAMSDRLLDFSSSPREGSKTVASYHPSTACYMDGKRGCASVSGLIEQDAQSPWLDEKLWMKHEHR